MDGEGGIGDRGGDRGRGAPRRRGPSGGGLGVLAALACLAWLVTPLTAHERHQDGPAFTTWLADLQERSPGTRVGAVAALARFGAHGRQGLMSATPETFDSAFSKAVDLGNKLADKDKDADLWDIADGLLIVESDSNDVFVLVRLAPPQLVERSRYETALSMIVCGNIKVG